jgi:hypothetical protein
LVSDALRRKTMPDFEVEYSWQETQYGVTTVTAEDVDKAEIAALEQLSDTLDDEIQELCIESLREIKH